MHPLRNQYKLYSQKTFFLCAAEVDLLIIKSKEDLGVPLSYVFEISQSE